MWGDSIVHLCTEAKRYCSIANRPPFVSSSFGLLFHPRLDGWTRLVTRARLRPLSTVQESRRNRFTSLIPHAVAATASSWLASGQLSDARCQPRLRWLRRSCVATSLMRARSHYRSKLCESGFFYFLMQAVKLTRFDAGRRATSRKSHLSPR